MIERTNAKDQDVTREKKRESGGAKKQHHIKKARTVPKEGDEEQYKQSETKEETKDRG